MVPWSHQGYMFVRYPQHHFAQKNGIMLQHRVIYEEYHKCSLLPWGHIHHINGIGTDNRIENLQAYTQSQHCRLEHLGEKNPHYGKHLSEEHKRRLSISGKGKKRSEETKRKIALAKMGPKNPNYGKIPWNKKHF